MTKVSDSSPSAGQDVVDQSAGSQTDGGASASGNSNEPSSEGGVKSILGAAKDGNVEGAKASGETKSPAGEGDLEIVIPKGAELDEGMLAWFKTQAKEMGLTSEKASDFLAKYHEQAQVFAKKQVEQWDRQSQEWEKSLREDPDIGGQKFNASIAAAHRAILKFGGRPLAEEIDRLGIGNNPMLCKAFVRIGNAIGEDNTGGITSQSAAKPTMDDILSKLYPSSAQG